MGIVYGYSVLGDILFICVEFIGVWVRYGKLGRMWRWSVLLWFLGRGLGRG